MLLGGMTSELLAEYAETKWGEARLALLAAAEVEAVTHE